MAKGYINGIYSKTFLDGREFQPWLSDTGAQLAGEADGGGRGLEVERHGRAPDLRVDGRPRVRVLDHEVRVQRNGRDRPDPLDDRRPEREVGDEVVVHDVDVRHVRRADAREFAGEVREVRGQDARIDVNAHGISLAPPQEGEEHRVRVVEVRHSCA